jgi:hypothetical protein
MDLRVMPDAKELVAAYLRDQPEVQALLEDRVYGEIPDPAVYPLAVLTVVPSAGQAVRERLDEVHLQVDAWSMLREEGGSPEEAQAIAAVLRAAILAEERITGAQPVAVPIAVVQGTRDVMGPQELPDPVTARPRYLFEVAIFLHPL